MIVREFINKIGFAINESQFNTVETRVNALKGKLQKFGILGTAFITAPFIGLNIWVGKTLSEFEQLDVAFETMLGSADKAKVLVEDMLQFAAKTPFEIRDIGPVTKQLLATGSTAKGVMNDLRILGNAAAGAGVPMSRLALNFGQVRAQGKLTGREMRDFAVAGINMRKVIGDMLGVNEKMITQMVSQGKIGFDVVAKAFEKMSAEGGIYHNLMIKQSKTLGGMWSNFKDLITLTVKDYTKDLLPMFKGIVNFLIKLLDMFKKMSPEFKKALFFIGALSATIGPLILAFTVLVKVGLMVRGALLSIAAAAKIANISTSLFLLKFALIGVAIAIAGALSVGAYDDITTFLKGGDSLIGSLIKRLTTLNEKLKKAGGFTLDVFRDMFKDLDKLFQAQMDILVGIFTGRWKFAIDSVKQAFIDAFEFLTDMVAAFLQPLFDIRNKFSGENIKIGDEIRKSINAHIAAIPSTIEKTKGILGAVGRFAGEAGRSISQPIPEGAGGGIQTTIHVNVGENVTPNQIKDIGSNVEIAIEKTMQRYSRNVLNAMPQQE